VSTGAAAGSSATTSSTAGVSSAAFSPPQATENNITEAISTENTFFIGLCFNDAKVEGKILRATKDEKKIIFFFIFPTFVHPNGKRGCSEGPPAIFP
jgi:hypothetical protein